MKDTPEYRGKLLLAHMIWDGKASALNEKACLELIAGDTLVDMRNALGETPLILAAQHGSLAITKALLASRADPDMTDNAGNSALKFAVQYRDDKIAGALLNAGAVYNLHDEDPGGWVVVFGSGAAHSFSIDGDKKLCGVFAAAIQNRFEIEAMREKRAADKISGMSLKNGVVLSSPLKPKHGR